MVGQTSIFIGNLDVEWHGSVIGNDEFVIDSSAYKYLFDIALPVRSAQMAPARLVLRHASMLRSTIIATGLRSRHLSTSVRGLPSLMSAVTNTPRQKIGTSLRWSSTESSSLPEPPDYLNEAELKIFNIIKQELQPTKLEVSTECIARSENSGR